MTEETGCEKDIKRLEEFNEDCFKNLIDKIIVGEIDDNGNKNPNVIKFILKTGKNYDFLIDNQKHCMSFCKRNKEYSSDDRIRITTYELV